MGTQVIRKKGSDSYNAIIKSISDLDSAVGSDITGDWLIVNDLVLNSSKTLPDSVTLHFRKLATITFGDFNLVGSLTNIVAENTKIFEYTGTGKITGTWSVDGFVPQWWGALGDGVADEAKAFQDMFNSVPISEPTCVIIPPKSYLINTQLTLPPIKSSSNIFEISGYGATLKTTEAITILDRTPADSTEASVWVSSQFKIAGLRLQGSKIAGQIGLHLGASYGSEIIDCVADGFEYGFIGTFMLQGRFINCRASNLITDFTIRSGAGIWTGGVTTNSASNVTIFDSCHAGQREVGKFSGFSILASDAVRLTNCIIEGNTSPNWGVYFDYGGSTTVKNFYIDNIHVEGIAPEANVKLIANGQCLVRGMRRSNDAVLIDATGSASGSTVRVSDFRYMDGLTYFFKSGVNIQWTIEDVDGSNVGNSDFWVDNILPTNLHIRRINTYYTAPIFEEGLTSIAHIFADDHIRPTIDTITENTSVNINSTTAYYKCDTSSQDITVNLTNASANVSNFDMNRKVFTFINTGDNQVIFALYGGSSGNSIGRNPQLFTGLFRLYNKDDSISFISSGDGVWDILNYNTKDRLITDDVNNHGCNFAGETLKLVKDSKIITFESKYAWHEPRKVSTAYAVGDMTSTRRDTNPTNYLYQECIVAGTTSDSGSIPPPPNQLGATFVDGTVTWIMRSYWDVIGDKATIGITGPTYSVVHNEDGIILGDVTSNAITVTLPEYNTIGSKCKIGHSGSGDVTVNNITIDVENDAYLIDGATTKVIATANEVVELVFTGTQYKII